MALLSEAPADKYRIRPISSGPQASQVSGSVVNDQSEDERCHPEKTSRRLCRWLCRLPAGGADSQPQPIQRLHFVLRHLIV